MIIQNFYVLYYHYFNSHRETVFLCHKYFFSPVSLLIYENFMGNFSVVTRSQRDNLVREDGPIVFLIYHRLIYLNYKFKEVFLYIRFKNP